jgi:hypothetical protein
MSGRILALSLFVLVAVTTGCITTPKSDSDLPTASGRGMGTSSPGTPSSEDEEWSKMGRQMRGDAPAQQSWDPLRNVMMSPKAQSIERSLGVDN